MKNRSNSNIYTKFAQLNIKCEMRNKKNIRNVPKEIFHLKLYFSYQLNTTNLQTRHLSKHFLQHTKVFWNIFIRFQSLHHIIHFFSSCLRNYS